MEQKQVQIEVDNIEKLALTNKKVVSETGIKHITRIQFECEGKVSNVARLLYLQKQGKPINVTFACPQAEFDLNITPVKVETGEIAPAELPDYLK